jgi:transketolase
VSRSNDTPPLDERSRHLRGLVIDALEGGQRGHIGSSLSLIEIFRVLYDDVLNHDPKNPEWAGRDRSILSKGHGCLALYAVLADAGYFPTEDLRGFCRLKSKLGGHPERGKVPGVEASTGSLGHGLSVGIGMALAQRMRNSDARVFVVMGDGEINEGSVWEAAMCAGKHKLDNLIAMVDYNKIQSFGFTRDVQDLEPLTDKWRSFGFDVHEVDGHDVAALRRVLEVATDTSERPQAIICHTIKGKGLSFAENEPSWHHKSSLKPDAIAQMREALEAL